MKQIYNILSFLLIFNVHTFLKNVECNGHINENDTKNIKNGLPDNNLEIENVLNIRGSTFDKLKNDLGESSNEDKKGENKIYNEGYTFLHGKEINDNHGMVMNFSNKDEEIPFSGSSSEDENKTKYDPKDVCNPVGSFSYCPRKDFDLLYDWNRGYVKNALTDNMGVHVPPRRTKLCLLNVKKANKRKWNTDKLKTELLKDASGESHSLFKFFENKHYNSFLYIKYSFADIADIIKGKDMMDNNISNTIQLIFQKEKETDNSINPEDWWKKHRDNIWEVMMCGQSGTKNEKCPGHNDVDEIPQFFRWFSEWGISFCKEYETEMHYVSLVCISKKTNNEADSPDQTKSKNDTCVEALKNYENWFNIRRPQWIDQIKKYNKDQSKYEYAKDLSPEDFLKRKSPECIFKNLKFTDLFENSFDKQKLLDMLKETPSNDESRSDTSVETPQADSQNARITEERQHDEENPEQSATTEPLSVPSASDNSSTVPSKNDSRVPVTNYDPYERLLGLEFGNVKGPGINPYISSKESDSLELINLTSWDKEDIMKQNEDVKDEIE
ncbi:duffy binding-like merozoite surface protein, partial [Plasmodium gaboni]